MKLATGLRPMDKSPAVSQAVHAAKHNERIQKDQPEKTEPAFQAQLELHQFMVVKRPLYLGCKRPVARPASRIGL